MLLANATIRIKRPVRVKTGLDRETRYNTLPEQRASLRRLTPGQAVNVLGTVALNAWSLRLHARDEIGPGMTVEVMRDGGDDWTEYKVLTVNQGMYTRAIVEAVE